MQERCLDSLVLAPAPLYPRGTFLCDLVRDLLDLDAVVQNNVGAATIGNLLRNIFVYLGPSVDHLQDEVEFDVDLFDAGNGILDAKCGADDEGVLDILLEALKAREEAFELFLP